MEPTNSLDSVVKEEVLRERIRKILNEPPSSRWQSFSRHPLTAIVVGFLFTVVLAEIIKRQQDLRDKAAERREHVYEMRIDSVRQKHAAGLSALEVLSEIMYSRLTRSAMLGAALTRNATLLELEVRKAKLDEAYAKWNVQRRKTYLTLQEIDLTLYPQIKKYDDSLMVNYRRLDLYLMTGYDKRRAGQQWKPDRNYIQKKVARIQSLSDVMLTSIWVSTRINQPHPMPVALER